MSHANGNIKSVTTTAILKKHHDGEKISMITCYDSAFGKLIDVSPIDMILVGDSLGNVILGHDSTIPVTIDDMVHHSAAVTRIVKRAFVAADMPFMTYATVEQALKNATFLIQKGGAAAVKLEGGESICPQVHALVSAGIPVIGHLGLTPQSVHALGGYRVQGKTKEARKRLLADAKALELAGVFCIVLELVPADLAKEITESLQIPTIGIGAGVHCSGQVLVLHDMLGFNSEFSPKFLKKFANLGAVVAEALVAYDSEVKTSKYPSTEHSFGE